MKVMIVALFAALMASAAFAGGFDDNRVVISLGELIGSEIPCGLHFDQDAIRQYISKHVPASDMGFTANLQSYADATQDEFSSMSQSEKTAQCFQVERAAEANGLLGH